MILEYLTSGHIVRYNSWRFIIIYIQFKLFRILTRDLWWILMLHEDGSIVIKITLANEMLKMLKLLLLFPLLGNHIFYNIVGRGCCSRPTYPILVKVWRWVLGSVKFGLFWWSLTLNCGLTYFNFTTYAKYLITNV